MQFPCSHPLTWARRDCEKLQLYNFALTKAIARRKTAATGVHKKCVDQSRKYPPHIVLYVRNGKHFLSKILAEKKHRIYVLSTPPYLGAKSELGCTVRFLGDSVACYLNFLHEQFGFAFLPNTAPAAMVT